MFSKQQCLLLQLHNDAYKKHLHTSLWAFSTNVVPVRNLELVLCILTKTNKKKKPGVRPKSWHKNAGPKYGITDVSGRGTPFRPTGNGFLNWFHF